MAEIREALEAAFTKAESTETPAPVAAVESATPAPVEAAETVAAPAETAAEKAARERDDKGRFAPKKAEAKPAEKVPAQAEALKAAEAPKPVAPVTPAAPKYKPPQSWKPALRDMYGTLPESVQEEIDRREREIATGLQESAPAKKFREDFDRVFTPYMPMLRAGGADPVQALQGMAQTFHTLQSGTVEQKARLVFDAIQRNGIPLEAINAYFDNPQAQPQQQQAAPDPQEIEQRVMQKIHHQQAVAQWQTFAASNEYAEDVRPLMATVIEARARAGNPVKGYEEAYKIACQIHPDVSAALAKRSEAERQKAEAAAATAQNEAMAKARAAGTSVRTQPGPVSAGPAKGIRGALEEAFAKAGKR